MCSNWMVTTNLLLDTWKLCDLLLQVLTDVCEDVPKEVCDTVMERSCRTVQVDHTQE